MEINKNQLWPQTGKLNKALIIVCIVIVSALLFVLLEEKSAFRIYRKLTYLVALACCQVVTYFGCCVIQFKNPVSRYAAVFNNNSSLPAAATSCMAGGFVFLSF